MRSFMLALVFLLLFPGAILAAEGNSHKLTDEQKAKLSRKLSDPSSNIWALFTEFDFMSISGDKAEDSEFSQAIIFQPIMPIPLTEDFKLLARPTLPILTAPTIQGVKDDGNYDVVTKFGLGNLQLPLMLSPNDTGDFGIGLGPTFVFPTNTDDKLGADTVDMGPAAVFVYKPKGFIAGVLGEYWWSVYEDTGEKEQSYGELIYFLYKDIGKGRQIGSSATITYNNEADEANQWNVPVALTYGFMTRLGKMPMKVQIGFEYSIVHEEDFGKQFMFKFNLIPVVKALVQKPIFE